MYDFRVKLTIFRGELSGFRAKKDDIRSLGHFSNSRIVDVNRKTLNWRLTLMLMGNHPCYILFYVFSKNTL